MLATLASLVGAQGPLAVSLASFERYQREQAWTWEHMALTRARPVFGSINMGIVLGLGQFVTTFVITSIYVVYANKKLDPKAQALRAEFEAQEASS